MICLPYTGCYPTQQAAAYSRSPCCLIESLEIRDARWQTEPERKRKREVSPGAWIANWIARAWGKKGDVFVCVCVGASHVCVCVCVCVCVRWWHTPESRSLCWRMYVRVCVCVWERERERERERGRKRKKNDKCGLRFMCVIYEYSLENQHSFMGSLLISWNMIFTSNLTL